MTHSLKNFFTGNNHLKHNGFKLNPEIPEIKIEQNKVEELSIPLPDSISSKKVNHFKDTKFLYTPVIGEQIISNKISARDMIDGKELNWWEEENSIISHPGALVSAFYGLLRSKSDDSKKYSYRKDLGISANTLFLGDSGGFQLKTLKHNPSYSKLFEEFTPEWVLEWQEANCDGGFVLDRPPYVGSTDKHTYRPELFNESMEFTNHNSQIMFDQKKENFKLYGVLQGRDYQSIKKWHNSMKDFPVDGWALAPKPATDVMATAVFAAFALEHKFDVPIHFFAISGMNTLAFIIYLLRKDSNGDPYYPHLITADSSSYNYGIRYRRYMIPFDYNYYVIFGRNQDEYHPITKELIAKKNPNASTLSSLPCDCKICQHSTPASLSASTNIAGISIALHNLNQYNSFIRVLTSLIDEPDKYKAFVRRTAIRDTNSPEFAEEMHKSIKAMNYIDKIVENKGTTSWENLVHGARSFMKSF